MIGGVPAFTCKCEHVVSCRAAAKHASGGIRLVLLANGKIMLAGKKTLSACRDTQVVTVDTEEHQGNGSMSRLDMSACMHGPQDSSLGSL